MTKPTYGALKRQRNGTIDALRKVMLQLREADEENARLRKVLAATALVMRNTPHNQLLTLNKKKELDETLELVKATLVGEETQ